MWILYGKVGIVLFPTMQIRPDPCLPRQLEGVGMP